MSRLRKIVALFTVAAALLVGGVVVWADSSVRAPGPLAESTSLVVTKGAGLTEIAHKLAGRGVIDSPTLFVLVAWIDGAQHQLRAGEYAFEERVSIRQAIDILREGRTVVRRVTIAEGLTSQEVVAVLKDADGLEGDLQATPPEGSLLPNTYHYSLGDSRTAIVDRMTAAMQTTLAALWEERASGLPLATPQEALILASIVEKETAVPEERARVAAVFVNRLRKRMRLESDPTVVYGLTGGSGPLGRALLRKDLRRDHPYNTYRIKGLPPGPIANPGRDSLAAVMNPIESEELFFVADGTGGHAFAKTLEEHNRNVAKWRKIRREQRRKQRQRQGSGG